MQPRTLKWLIPAAAAAVILVMVGVWPAGRSDGKVYGMADVAQLLGAARTLHISGRLFVPPYSMPGTRQTEVRLEMWLESGAARARQSTVTYSAGNDGFKISRGERVCDGEYRMEVDHDAKTVTYGKLNLFRRQLQSQLDLDGLYRGILGRLKETVGFAKTGQEDIGGKSYDIWEGTIEEAQVGMSLKTKWWLAPHTGQIGRMQMSVKGPYSEEWVPAVDITAVQRNVTPPAGVFDTTPPEGYTVLTTKEAAEVPELAVESGGGLGSISYTGHIAFQLPDGSVILGWSSTDKEDEGSQAGLFSGLEIGGPLPKLPMEIHALTRVVQGKEFTYAGRHLVFTRTGDRYHEWALYVADQDLAGKTLSTYYRIAQKYNVEPNRITGSLTANVSQPIFIGDPASFDTFVRGAMAELSDGGAVPKEITYENVLRLVAKIRASLDAPGQDAPSD